VTWSRMLGYLLAAAGLRWVAHHWWADADAYLAAGVIGVWLVLAFHRHTRGYAIADALNRATDDQREALLARLQPRGPSADLEPPTLTLEEALNDTLTFTYPKGSRSFTTFQFWLCALLGGGFLAPLALGRITDPGDGWILFLLGGWIALAGAGHRRRLRWLGTELSVGPDAVTEVDAKGRSRHLSWPRIAAIREARWSRILELQAIEAPPIRVWPELVARDQFVSLVEEHLRSAGRRAA
jgi:hypothetical protein